MAWQTYFLAALPEWILVAAAAWALPRYTSMPAWLAWALLAAWVVKDVVAYPRLRRFYRPEAPERMVGRLGHAVTAVSPRGTVRVRGELWQAEVQPGAKPIDEGGGLQVLAVRGLTLIVGPRR